jgi:ADP-L-glycero-D-manno-heptose 6-epimerase
MIVVTGAAGFISSCLISALNKAGHTNIIAVDDFSREDKNKNLTGKKIIEKINRNEFFAWASDKGNKIDFVFHLGARTDTTEFNKAIFDELNVKYSQDMWSFCTENSIPLVYASSAATYGLGEFGYEDRHDIIEKLKPLNPYGDSKNEFDKWVLKKIVSGDPLPPFWSGLKFFNVYGPNEYHKARMASVIFHAFNQISQNGSMKLFRSHKAEYADGGQLRDFIYVKDVVSVCLFMMNNKPESGIYNLGTGKARAFNDLAHATFAAMNVPPLINYIDTPADIRDKYQYFTEANMSKLLRNGYKIPFHSLEEGVKDYVQNYLTKQNYF